MACAVGAHPSLPDLQGFGRREMKIGREELANCLIYQIGALKGFLDAEGMTLNHIKPHGALYGMAARIEDVAHAVCDAADVFQTPLLGMIGTLHETIYAARGHRFIAEFYADLDYSDDGGLIITREHEAKDPASRRVQVPARDRRGQGDAASADATSPSARKRSAFIPTRRTPSPSRPPFAPPSGASPSVRKLEEGTMSKQILSPLPGTFYRRPAPDKPPFKADGDTVAVGDVIGLIEVMKSFIEVHADASGAIVQVRRRQRRARHGGPAARRGRLDMEISRLLIANRGEIAVRIQRAARELGVTTIQAHSAADADSLAVQHGGRSRSTSGRRRRPSPI